jgi:UDP-N-acetylglucosamine 2-epimerase (non-hydrolysing)
LIKALSIFGTRPEAIKMAPLVNALKADNRFESYVCVTAQHRDMLDQVLKIFDIRPDFDLDIMEDRQSLTDITVNALLGLEKVIKELNPDIILVHGDTTTTFIGSLAAFYNKIRIGHVEAGLRTFNKYFPYPEEMNRKLTGAMADIHFSPTSVSKANLIKEGIPEESIFITGNTAIDALRTTVKKDFRFYTSIMLKPAAFFILFITAIPKWLSSKASARIISTPILSNSLSFSKIFDAITLASNLLPRESTLQAL